MAGMLILTHGLPGSGKSSLAEELRGLYPGRIWVAERDELRAAMLPADYHSRGHDNASERIIDRAQDQLIREALARGEVAVVSDTNLTEIRIRRLVTIARSFGARIAHVHFDISVAEAKRRNEARAAAGGRLVPDWAIEDMAEYGYEDGRLKFFSIIPQSSEPGDFSVAIEARSDSDPTMEDELNRVRSASLEVLGSPS